MVNLRDLCLSLLLTLALPGPVNAADPPQAAGFLIYKAIPAMPDRDAKLIEFTWAEEFPQVVNYKVADNPRSGRLFREKVPAVVRYPEFGDSTLTTPAEFGALQKETERLVALAEQFPQAAPKITPAIATLNQMLETYAAGKVLVKGVWIDQDASNAPPRDKGSYIDMMTVKEANGSSKTYYDVHVLTIEPDRVRITHSEGSAAIPHSKLPDELKELWKFKG